jgi:hypothetical protein
VPTTPSVPQVVAAAATGVATTAYYATPDVIRSRAARGWVKTGLGVALTASSLPELRRVQEEARARREARPEEERVDVRQALAGMPAGRKAALGAVAAGLVAGSVASVVVAERWIFRRGEARLAAGKPYAHTRVAVVLGVLAGAMMLVPDVAEAEAPGAPTAR